MQTNQYFLWRDNLTKKTLTTLREINDLSELNTIGCFHKILNKEFYERMEKEWSSQGQVPASWISKGRYFGLWTALFDPCNTYSKANEVNIIKLTFKEGFSIYDCENEEHQKLQNNWKSKKENEWVSMLNDKGISLEQRMKDQYPSHKSFYEEHKFGSVIGYSDYIANVVVLEESIANIEFL